MERLFKVIHSSEVYESSSNQATKMRDVVLVEYVPCVGKNGQYVGKQTYACTLFNDDADRWTIPAGAFMVGELKFKARLSNGHWFQTVRVNRCCVMTQSDFDIDVNTLFNPQNESADGQ